MATAPKFDLCHLKAEHGSDAVNETLQICRQAELRLLQQLIFDGCSITRAWGWKVIVERAWAHGAARLTHGGAAAGEA
jgi:hypothetical protein